MLEVAASRERQRRLLPILANRRLDAAVIGLPHHIYYFSAHWPFWQHVPALILWNDGGATLCAANEPAHSAAADEAVTYEASWSGTLRQEQPAACAEVILKRLAARHARRIGIDASQATSHVALGFDGEITPVDPEIWQLRRRKDLDELALMKQAIACTSEMYRTARGMIEPGVTEFEVFAALHAAALRTAGEPLMPAHLGNDYACGVPGGTPRGGRRAQAGEIYILDVGPAYRGYFSDNCRSLAVNRKPTDEQHRAWQLAVDALAIVERLARPGARCRDIYAAVDERYLNQIGQPFPHHLGHGVGLQPHEFPHLNPKWDDVLMEGEVFTAEPGLYGAQLAGGLRLENQYLVTANGVENLTPFPLELA